MPAGQSTQMIVGASSDSDLRIIRLSQSLYDHFKLKRVYYSAYVPVNENPNLPALNQPPPMKRENRLYQADWLLRFYGFRAEELLDEGNPHFDTDLDPKCDWALRHPEEFPLEINSAAYEQLLRIPGIGVKSAKKIMLMRRNGPVDFDNLKKLGVILKRARFFITCKGKYLGESSFRPERIKLKLTGKKTHEQLTMF